MTEVTGTAADDIFFDPNPAPFDGPDSFDGLGGNDTLISINNWAPEMFYDMEQGIAGIIDYESDEDMDFEVVFDLFTNIENLIVNVGSSVLGDAEDNVITFVSTFNMGPVPIGPEPLVPMYYYGSFATAGEGNDTVYAGIGNDYIMGNRGADALYGEAGMDQLYGNLGADMLSGGEGEDYLNGGKGDDEIYGDEGYDSLYGEKGDDYLNGGEGGDYLYGGEGDDHLRGFTGDDVLYGDGYGRVKRAGMEEEPLDEGDDYIQGGAGEDYIYGGGGDDNLNGGADSDEIEGGTGKDLLMGRSGDDDLFGGAGKDVLVGGNGHDYLNGGTGADTLKGGNDSDWLSGERGNDTLTGGEGEDYFEFGSDEGSDTITDFEDGVDQLALLGFGFMTDAEALDHFYEIGGANNDVVGFSFDGTEIRIEGVDLADITEDDFFIVD